MRKLLFFCLLLIVGVAALGYYLKWFSFSTTRDPDSGKKEFQLTVDQEKMKSDAQKVKEKATSGDAQAKEEPKGK